MDGQDPATFRATFAGSRMRTAELCRILLRMPGFSAYIVHCNTSRGARALQAPWFRAEAARLRCPCGRHGPRSSAARYSLSLPHITRPRHFPESIRNAESSDFSGFSWWIVLRQRSRRRIIRRHGKLRRNSGKATCARNPIATKLRGFHGQQGMGHGDRESKCPHALLCKSR